MKTPYRYRWDGASSGARKRFERLVKRLGHIKYVRGYRWQGRWGKREGVLLVGENGSARFQGVCWGYSGEGPRTLINLLIELGVSLELANAIGYEAKRGDDVGDDWRLTPVDLEGIPYWVYVNHAGSSCYVPASHRAWAA